MRSETKSFLLGMLELDVNKEKFNLRNCDERIAQTTKEMEKELADLRKRKAEAEEAIARDMRAIGDLNNQH